MNVKSAISVIERKFNRINYSKNTIQNNKTKLKNTSYDHYRVIKYFKNGFYKMSLSKTCVI